jgi:hypothetical protein
VSTALHFGGSFGPPDYEPLALAQAQISKFLRDHANYHIPLNQEFTERMIMDLPERTGPLAPAMPRATTTQARQVHGGPDMDTRPYVDDTLAAALATTKDMHRMGASIAEGSYLAFGHYPGPLTQPILPPVIAWDKLEDRKVSPQREMIGNIPDSDEQILTLPNRRLDNLYVLIVEGWLRPKKNQCTAKEAAKLMGQLISCAAASSWFSTPMLRVRSLVQEALKDAIAMLKEDKEKYLNAQKILRANPSKYNLKNAEASLLLVDKWEAKLAWAAKAYARVSSQMVAELKWIVQIIEQHRRDGRTWSIPFSHIVRDFETCRAWQDASLKWGIGGWNAQLNYFFNVNWDDIDPKIRNTFLNAQGRDHESGLTDINVNEQIAEIMQYAAEITRYQQAEYKLPVPPKVHNVGDNKSANTWASGKMKTHSTKARNLAKLRASLSYTSGVGSMTSQISTEDNDVADRFSRTEWQNVRAFLNSQTHDTLTKLLFLQTNRNSDQTMYLERFHPSRDLLSAISSAIWNTLEDRFPVIDSRNLGHFDPGSSISLSFSSTA